MEPKGVSLTGDLVFVGVMLLAAILMELII